MKSVVAIGLSLLLCLIGGLSLAEEHTQMLLAVAVGELG